MGILNFFRKNKNDEPSNNQASNQGEKYENDNFSFIDLYNNFSEQFRSDQSLLDARLKGLTDKNYYAERKDWIEGLAICNVCLEKNTYQTEAQDLHKQLYKKNWNKYISMNLSDDDYKDWFDTNFEINKKFIESGYSRGYCEQADLFGNARIGYRNIDKETEYLKKGVDVKDGASLAGYAYGLYFGLGGHKVTDKEKAIEMINESKALGYESAGLFELYLDFNEDIDLDVKINKVEAYIDATKVENDKPYHLLADCFLRKDELKKATEILEKGIKANNSYCKYSLGLNTLNGRLNGIEKSEAIKLIEEAYQYYVINAASFLGQYYYMANDENSSVEKAISWFQKAALYGESESLYELGCIYLYNNQYKDVTKGLDYLEQALASQNVRALSEKAYLMLETDILERNIPEAKRLLEEADEKGNPYAPYRLGLGYANAEFVETSDYQKALEYFEKGASRQHIYSMELAGNYYRLGVGGDSEESKEKAIRYLNQAIEHDSNYARVEMAFCYESGFGVEQDYQKAFDLLTTAANNNYSYANTRMAIYLEDGLVGNKDYNAALENYKIAAEAGIPDAIYNIGRYYRYGVGIPENPELALQYFKDAAEKDSAAALTELALCYEDEYAGLQFDADKTLEYMTAAAEKNYTFAQYKVGTYYYFGLKEADTEKAKYWFEKSFEQNYPYSAIMLGEMYLYNVENKDEPEYNKAFDYYKQAADYNVWSEGLGICYEYGFGVETNETEAYKYYSLAANNNSTAAKYRLGLCYRYGTGTTANATEAYRWLSDAAENGNLYANYETAMLELDGNGTEKNEQEAVKRLMKAAEDDYHWAQFELGNCYLTGRGIPEDEVQAMIWYQKAADNGNEQAQKITGRRERRKNR